MDLVRPDWQSTPIAPDANGQFEFIFYATAPHATQTIVFYMTAEGRDPAQPLRWDDLEEFCRHDQVSLADLPGGKKGYRMTCNLPPKRGRHIIFNTWQRSDNPEGFYACSDVEITDSTEPQLTLLGTIVASQDLPAGTIINFRLFDEASMDIEQIETVVQDNEGASNLWPFHLAQTVNERSQWVRIGRLSENGTVEPSQQANANLVYSLRGRELTFVIDKQVPGDPNTPNDPNDDAVDYVYPQSIGQYGPGTIVQGQNGERYQCKPFPFSGWCNQAPAYYAPGMGYAWEEAWIKL